MLELELLCSNSCYRSWSWRVCALKLFIELELELISSRLFFWLELELRVLVKNVGAKSGAAKVMFQVSLETHLKLYFSNIFLVIIKNIILRSNNAGNVHLEKGFQNPQLAFYLEQMDKSNKNLNSSWSFLAHFFFQSSIFLQS